MPQTDITYFFHSASFVQDDPNSCPARKLEKTTRASSIAETIQRDLRAYNLTLNEAVNLAQNRPLWRLMSTYGAMHS